MKLRSIVISVIPPDRLQFKTTFSLFQKLNNNKNGITLEECLVFRVIFVRVIL